MAPRPAALTLTEHLPARELVAGEALFGPDDTGEGLVVLVSGRLQVEAGGAALGSVDVPGAFVGEIAALLGTGRTADVVADGPVTVRHVASPVELFAAHPELGLELARQLAARLHRLTAYLVDVRGQYAGSDGHLGMVDSVLGTLSSRPAVDIEPGSERPGPDC